jgi:aquaporin Z
MLSAAEVFVRIRGIKAVYCAKFHHQNSQPCPFICGYHDCGNKKDAIEVTKSAHLFTSAMNGLF